MPTWAAPHPSGVISESLCGYKQERLRVWGQSKTVIYGQFMLSPDLAINDGFTLTPDLTPDFCYSQRRTNLQ